MWPAWSGRETVCVTPGAAAVTVLTGVGIVPEAGDVELEPLVVGVADELGGAVLTARLRSRDAVLLDREPERALLGAVARLAAGETP